MNFIEFRDMHFEGDTDAAIRQLAKEGYTLEFTYTKDADNLKIIIDTLETPEANQYMVYFNEEIDKNPARFKRAQSIVLKCCSMGMTLDEVKKAKENPFIKPFLTKFTIGLGLFLTMVLIICVLNIFNVEKWICQIVGIPGYIGIGLFCYSFYHGKNAISFKRAKKLLEKDNNSN